MWNRLREVFAIDLRTLVLLRVCLASLILVDLICRSTQLTDHYTDWGILPRQALLSIAGWRASLHLATGSTAGQVTLFLIAALFAIALLVGYRTRLMTFLSWVMLMSLQARNPIVLHGGDLLLLSLLFWAMFLPLGTKFSVDAALDKSDAQVPNQHFSAATVALLVQVMSVYFFTALLKSSPVWLPNGTAVELAMRIDHITTSVGVWMRDLHTLDRMLTYYVWGLELIAPLLVFVPLFFPWIRVAGLVLLIAMHVGFLVCLNIGLFPAVSITSLLAFTPSLVWDKLAARVRSIERMGVRIYYDKDCGFCLKTCKILRELLLPSQTPILPAQEHADVYAVMQQHNSWVVVDHDGSQHVRFQALALLFKRSPIFSSLACILAAKWMAAPGERFYAWVARNRARLGELSAIWLPYRSNPSFLPF